MASGSRASDGRYGDACGAITASSDRLCLVLGNATEIVAQTKALAQAMGTLVAELKTEAATEPSREV